MRKRRIATLASMLGAAFVLVGFEAAHQALALRVASPPASQSTATSVGAVPGLRDAVAAAVGAEQTRFSVRRSAAGLVASGNGLSARFGRSGPEVHAGRSAVSFRLTGYGAAGALVPAGSTKPSGSHNVVSYRRGELVEWYRNGPIGLEQGFTIEHRPEIGAAPLTMALELSGRLVPRQSGADIVFVSPGARLPAMRYGGLSAIDAAGLALPARLELRGRTLLVIVDDARARYPLTIDPLIQEGTRLSPNDATPNGTDPNSNGVEFGSSVSLSADGMTALIGAPTDHGGYGAAWVFTRVGAAWTQSGPKLTVTGGFGFDAFGRSVALSADGSTALLVGEQTSAAIFVRSGSAWVQQGPKLVSPGNVGFNGGAALSSDGDTALIGSPDIDSQAGAAWVFVRTGTTWAQQGAKLVPGDHTGTVGFVGESVALSADGTTALIGGPGESNTAGSGAAWAFTRSGSAWTQQGPKLVPTDETGGAGVGQGVALSSDGDTALLGGPGDNAGHGAAWAFTRSAGTWTQQGPKLVGGGETGAGAFGRSVALSSDGNTGLVGGPRDQPPGGTSRHAGAVWAFNRSGGSWSQQGLKATTNDDPDRNSEFGTTVALSGDGVRAMVGGPNYNVSVTNNTGAGAAWGLAFAAVSLTAPSSTIATVSTAQVLVTGISTPGATVNLFDGSASLGTAVANPAGTYSKIVVLAVGPHSLTATATVNGSTSAPTEPVSVVVFGQATFTAPSAASPTTTALAIPVSGTGGLPGATIEIRDGGTAVSATSPQIGTATVASNGAWSTTVTLGNAADGWGVNTLGATETLNGTSSTATVGTRVVTAVPAAPELTGSPDTTLIYPAALTLTATGTPALGGEQLRIFEGATTIADSGILTTPFATLAAAPFSPTLGTHTYFAIEVVNGFPTSSSTPLIVTVLDSPTTPQAPTDVVAIAADDGSVTLSWLPPQSDGGSPLTGYVATPFAGGLAQTPIPLGLVTSANLTGLENGTSYTFTVTATNALGSSPASVASNAVIPTVQVRPLPDPPPAVTRPPVPVPPSGAGRPPPPGH